MGKDKFKVHEGVFDEFTLNTLEMLKRKHYFDELGSCIKTGKEADVYEGKGVSEGKISGSKDETQISRKYAIKIFRINTANFKKISEYIQRDYRFRTLRGNKRKIILKWAQKEFRNLLKSYQAGVSVPFPYKQVNNVVVMDYIDGEMLKDVVLENPEEFFEELLTQIRILRHEAQLVHGDLSEYNILVYNNSPVIIDIGQAMTIKNESDFEEFFDLYKRDISNIIEHFNKRYGLKKNEEEVFTLLDKPL